MVVAIPVALAERVVLVVRVLLVVLALQVALVVRVQLAVLVVRVPQAVLVVRVVRGPRRSPRLEFRREVVARPLDQPHLLGELLAELGDRRLAACRRRLMARPRRLE